MSAFRLLALAPWVWLLAGCTLPVQGLAVEKGGLASTRPEGTIGPTGSEGSPPWQTYTVLVPSNLARTVTENASTFHLVVTDCRHKDAGRIHQDGHSDLNGWIGTEDVYIDGVTLNQSSGGHSKLQGKKSPIFQGVAYVSTSRIGNIPELCFQASGGNMIGLGFKTNTVRVRS